jgi:ribosome-associated heat shock protein Hsp15
MSTVAGATDPVRIDKWLWAARFFKTRSLATDAVAGGLVQLNGQRSKPSKDVQPGDELEITKGQARLVVVVRGTAERRGSATAAVELYEETEASLERRRLMAEQRRMEGPAPTPGGARPTKRDRRRLDAGPSTRRGRR